MKQSSVARLGVFSIVMITVGAVDSIRNLPAAALFGSRLILFYCLAALFFLFPVALVSAELASLHDNESGLYIWIRRAFGHTAGFMAIWFQWIENVIWYPTILSFVAGSVAFVVYPPLLHNHWYMLGVILVVFWLVTWLNCHGIQASARFASFCTVVGLFIPFALIIALGGAWLMGGHPSAIHVQDAWRLSSFSHLSGWVAFTGIMLSFCGVEIATVHAADVRCPKRTYPKALGISVLILLVTLLLASLSVAVMVPAKQLSLVAGILQAGQMFFQAYHLQWMLPLLAGCIILGALGEVNNWIIAPARGLLQAAEDDCLPRWLAKTNQCQAPVPILILQAVIVSLVALVFVVFPTVNESYWFLTVLASQLYMFVYLFMFLAVIKFRLMDKNDESAYRIPGGWPVLLLCCFLGTVACVFTIFIGFVPPGSIVGTRSAHYEWMLVVGLVLMILLPFVLYRWHNHQRPMRD